MKPVLNLFIALLFISVSTHSGAHDIGNSNVILRNWTINSNTKISGSFLLFKNNEVYVQLANSTVTHYPFSSFSAIDQQYVLKRYASIAQLNLASAKNHDTLSTTKQARTKVIFVLMCSTLILLIIGILGGERKWNYILLFSMSIVSAILYSFKSNSYLNTFSTSNPVVIDSAFTPFKPNIVTSWDNTYFYIESLGIPTTHGMMTGITSWQQQVPIPQCYLKPNAWMIPLNPVIAATPVPVDSIHFTRGAIAVAVNGIAIFNYHTNTGVDAYLDGQLDQWGGHCGRADDYHYHIAPLHLYNFTSATLPIAYALDGFAVYGSLEPDGTQMLPLDANNGHYGSTGIYHYHGVTSAPYMIGKMVGQITEDTTHQIVPQPHANPIRPALTPLSGAVITNCIANAANNGYNLVYTRNGITDSVVYAWTSTGQTTFNFYTNGSLTSTNTYAGHPLCFLPTSIDDHENLNGIFNIYPNPAHGEINIQLSKNIAADKILQTSILAPSGAVIYSAKNFNGNINLHELNSGVYQVILKTEKGTVARKVVVQ